MFVAGGDAGLGDAPVAVRFDGGVSYLNPGAGPTAGDVLWEEKRREDRIRELDVRVVRVAQEDLGALRAVSARITDLLATPLTGPRRFSVVRTPEPGRTDAAA